MAKDLILEAIKEIKDCNKELKTDIAKLSEIITEVRVDTAGVKEHLKNLNGKIIAHEQRLQNCETSATDNKISNAKLSAIVGVSTVASSGATTLALKLFGL
jgi:predicted nuclease with TOPRIM domain